MYEDKNETITNLFSSIAKSMDVESVALTGVDDLFTNYDNQLFHIQMNDEFVEFGYMMLVDGEDGHRIIHRKQSDENVSINIREMIISGEGVERVLTGNYKVDGINVQVKISQGNSNLIGTARVFIDGDIVAESEIDGSTSNPVSDFAGSLTESTSRFEAARKRDAIPFARKLIQDLAHSEPDIEASLLESQRMADKGYIIRRKGTS